MMYPLFLLVQSIAIQISIDDNRFFSSSRTWRCCQIQSLSAAAAVEADGQKPIMQFQDSVLADSGEATLNPLA